MVDLRRVLEQVGADGVVTHLQSGNAVFESPATPATLERRLARALAEELGLSVEVLVRTRAELGRIVRANPFAKAENDPLKLHVTFLAAKPTRARAAALPEGEGRDRLRLVGREVYLHTPDGYGRSKLSNAFLERRLNVAGTTRNWRTVTALAELASRRAS